MHDTSTEGIPRFQVVRCQHLFFPQSRSLDPFIYSQFRTPIIKFRCASALLCSPTYLLLIIHLKNGKTSRIISLVMMQHKIYEENSPQYLLRPIHMIILMDIILYGCQRHGIGRRLPSRLQSHCICHTDQVFLLESSHI